MKRHSKGFFRKFLLVFLCLAPAIMLLASCGDCGDPGVTTPAAENTRSDTETKGMEPKERREYKIKEILPKLKISGRCAAVEDGLTWDWSASGIEFEAECDGDVVMNYSSSGSVWFRCLVDGIKKDEIFKGGNGFNSTVIAKNLPFGRHILKIVRMTDVKSSMSVIRSLTLRGEFLPAPAGGAVMIEFLGDSLTCGTGNMKVPPGETEGLGGYRYMDATATFAFLLANDFIKDCDYSFVSIAGSHLAKSEKYENFLDVYKYTNYRRNTNDVWKYERKADIAVINLGTNDAVQKLSRTEFRENLKTLVDETRQTHGSKVPVVFILNMMRDNYIEEIREVASENGGEAGGMYLVNLIPDGAGASGHPSAEAHAEAARILFKFLKKRNLIR